MNQKGIAPIVLIVVAALVLVTAGLLYINKQYNYLITNPKIVDEGFFNSPIEPPLAKIWKTYTNTSVGFQIAYSADNLPYYVEGDHGGQSIDVNGTEDKKVINFPGKDQNYAIAFTLELLPYSGTLADAPQIKIQDRLVGYGGIDKPEKIQKDYKLAGLSTLWFRRPDETAYSKYSYEVFLVAKNHAFIFHTGPSTSEKQLEEILTTFNFTDKHTPPSAEGKECFTDTDCGVNATGSGGGRLGCYKGYPKSPYPDGHGYCIE